MRLWGSLMKSRPSSGFRHLCLALALMAMTWALPGAPARADFYPLQTGKAITDLLKPNVLVVLETAQSLQDLPGENAARYDEVGADCEEGSRFCRLVGQVGRWSWSGMGSKGMYFGDPNASCTSTVTITNTNTNTTTVTNSATATDTQTATNGSTSTITNTNTNTATNTNTNTTTKTQTNTNTVTNTGTVTNSNTVTNTNTNTTTTTKTQTNTNTNTGTVTNTNTNTGTNTVTNTGTVTNSSTNTSTSTVTRTNTTTNTGTTTNTNTVTNTNTSTGTTTRTNTGTNTNTNTNTNTQTRTNTNTVTNTATNTTTQTSTTTRTNTTTTTNTNTNTTTRTNTSTSTVTSTTTATHNFTATRTENDSSVWTFTGSGLSTMFLQSTDTGTSLIGVGTWGPGSVNVTGNASETATMTGTDSSTATATYTGSVSGTWTASYTQVLNGVSITYTRTTTTGSAGQVTGTSNFTSTGSRTMSGTWTESSTFARSLTVTSTATATATATGTATVTGTATASATATGTATGTASATGTITTTGTATGTGTTTATATGTVTGTGTSTGTATATQTGTLTGTATATATNTATGTVTGTATSSGTGTASGTTTGTVTATATGTNTGTVTATSTNTGTVTGTSTGSTTGTTTVTATSSATATGTSTATQSSTSTSTSTNTTSSTSTQTQTATSTNATTQTVTNVITVTQTATASVTQTETNTATSLQTYACGSQASTDPLACNGAVLTTNGYCNASPGVSCASDNPCVAIVKGDFCRFISILDGSGRNNNETCITSSGSPWGSCKHGVVTANTTCASSGDTSCNTALAGDFCSEGQPAKMCADTGLWCNSNADCPGNASTDLCVGATSRMMTVKRALRRAITDYSDKVNFGFMSTYQGRGLDATDTNASTAIYPYVKLQSCPASANVTETKLLTRGELEKSGCFTTTGGPSSTCTVDYGGNGAINPGSAALNQVTYTLASSNDSRWTIPRSDGSGKFTHVDASWSSCASSPILPACQFTSSGTGLYEGSYYSFSYKQGTPIANGGVDGEGSRAHPAYFTTYMGKYYNAGGGNCYNAVDAERSDIVNDGIYGRPAYTGTPWASANEVGVPWSGSTNGAACDATTGAMWASNVVPFLTDTTFNSTAVTSAQKALMIAGRLEKASFGGVDATGSLSPLSCTLQNDGASDKYHSAAAYMAQVQSNDTSNNGGNTPCWSNNIVLVVDGQPSGPGDMGNNIDCASTACAYDASTNPTLAGCNCAAITKAFSLAQSGIQTHVVVNAPNYAKDTLSWSTRFPYTYAFLWNVAVAGSPNHDGTPAFGTSEDEVYQAISAKIAAAAYHFPYTTAGAVAGATTQDPTTQIISQSAKLYDTSVSYPSWNGTLRSFDTTSSVALDWDAATVASQGHPGWNNRRVYFADTSGNVVKVQIANDSAGSIGNASALYSAGLGANSSEAELIMQWLLGKPGLGNPHPLMGPVSASTPIAVGQGAANGLVGSTQYSQTTWKRPPLVYVGSDDGVLHAFFAQAGSTTLNGTTYSGGEEAFAFIPNEMLPVITKLYAQGGQKLSFDSSQHIFGLASSPKVKDLCMGANCQSSNGTDWHTVLVMPEGPGGNRPFALDITNVIDTTNGLQPGNMTLLWSAAISKGAMVPSTWDYDLGQTTSVPAFYFAGYNSGAADNRVLFGSGYPTATRSGSWANQGLTIVNADAATGAVKDTAIVPTPQGSACTQTRALLADIAVARNYSSTSTSQYLKAAYAADTWGNTFQYVPTAATKLATLYTAGASGCDQPIYYGPAVVQLDRAPKADTSAKNFIYLAQVTGSALDPATAPVSSSYPGSQLIVTKLDGNVSPPVPVTSYNKSGASAQIVLSTAASTSAANRICLQSTDGNGSLTAFTNDVKTQTQSCADAGGVPLPESARPVATPTVALRSDGLGFQVIAAWYDPTAVVNNCSSGGTFNYGTSYVTVHEFGADGTWYQMAGVTLANTALTGIAFIGTGLFVDGIVNSAVPSSISIGETFSKTQQIENNNSGLGRFLRTTWTERTDL